MQVNVLWLSAALLSSPLLTLCDPLYILSAPQILRVGKQEKVLVEAQDFKEQREIRVNIRVMNFPGQNRDLGFTTVTLTPENKFLSLANITISHLEDVFDSNTEKKQYVYLKAEFDRSYSMEKIVMVFFDSGYIFLQTDKTIYTPDSTVLYRVFPLTQEAKFLVSPVVLEILTPEGIIIERQTYSSDKSMTYKLGSPISMGTWKIVASFKDRPFNNFSTEFEVKEYVLPSFEVKLEPQKPYFYIEDKSFTVAIKARYLFDQVVEGSAFVVFGVILKGNGTRKISFPKSLQRVHIIRGEGKAEFQRSHIPSEYSIEELIGEMMFVSVSVLTETGSEMVEAERRGIQIVKEPYTILFTRTPKYFKPGMPFDFWVYVTNPDGTPAEKVNLLVTPGDVEGRTDEKGIDKITINTQKGMSSLDITVRTVSEGIQAQNKMTALVYNPKEGSQNYLHIDVPKGKLRVGSQVTLKLNFGSSKIQNQDFTYMILSKGRIVDASRFQMSTESSLIAVSLFITKEMLPSFRVVGYYHVGAYEVVSDSVWIDVEDTCMGSLKVEVVDPRAAYSPTNEIDLKITGDSKAKVGLVAVDKGVYVLNNKNRLTQDKIWNTIEKSDMACTAGSGKDSMGVFYDAGLLFMSHTAGNTPERRDFSCQSKPKRRRRELTISQLRESLVGNYNQSLRQCCLDGLLENRLRYTCERRAQYVEDGEECREAFLRCCKRRADVKEATLQGELHLARNEEEDVDELFQDIESRSVFPESWMWLDEDLPECKERETCQKKIKQRLPESITTWVVTAISRSQDYGICVADQTDLIVAKPFFIDLKLPYSAVANEQIEIKAVIHNLGSSVIKAEVELTETESICSLASYKKRYRTKVNIPGKSSHSVPFVIIPLVPGKYSIGVKARDPNGLSDGVRKDLRVVTQGVLKSTGENTVILEPAKHGGTQRSEFKRSFLDNQMPGTEAFTYIAVRGRPISQLVNEAISGKGMDHMIKEPKGCGEQNLMAMVLPLIATLYLDKTNQWEDIGVDKRTEALSHIRTGYSNQLAFRGTDGQFSLYPGGKGSTWLTAYVIKMFSMSSNLVTIMEQRIICDAVKWIILKTQLPDGVFTEVSHIYSSAMGGKASQLSMTAFVLIALQEAKSHCEGQITTLQNHMDKAIDYIVKNIDFQTDPYAVAMASYALANANKLKQDILFKYASPDRTHWPVKEAEYFTLEATGYALLSLLKTGDFTGAAPIVKWLKTKEYYSSGYRSTQATAVVFEAIAKYMMERPPKAVTGGMAVTVTSTARATDFQVIFTKNNRGLQRSDRFLANGDLTVVSSGEGEGSISVVTLYYTKPDKNATKCKNFDLEVGFKRERYASYDNALETYTITIETKFLSPDKKAAMTILDVGLMTGFIPDTRDLEQLTGTDRYIDKYEMDKQLSERGSVIIYLKKVSNVENERIAFRLHKMLAVGLPQPAGVTVYEYYSPENRCMKFYDLIGRESATLHTLCPTEVCSCAEANCPQLKSDLPEEDERIKEACKERDYAYKATLKESKRSGSTVTYTFTITKELKVGTDAVQRNSQRQFLAHSQCQSKLDLKVNKDYLLMGPEPKKIEGSYRYILGSHTWLEYWPTSRESQEDKNNNRARYTGLAGLEYQLTHFGCTT
ncbi:complement C3-like [Hoplias malabaricus]|uniref:complement C3-like n=1 Tax=Hoplias malabaricus TaxID=27720 RepID=UPI00346250AF